MTFLRRHLRPADKPDAARIASLIDDLDSDRDSDRFSTREQASAELTRLGASAEPMFLKKRAEKVSLEMRKRIDLLLEKLDVLMPLSGEELRHIRAVEALEQVGTDEARQLLRTLAKGSECARLTREAKASLQRLDQLGQNALGYRKYPLCRIFSLRCANTLAPSGRPLWMQSIRLNWCAWP